MNGLRLEIRLRLYLFWRYVLHFHSQSFHAKEDGIYCQKCGRRFKC